MHVEVRHDAHIQGGASLNAEITAWVESGLMHFGEQIMSVEVHLADENGPKTGHDAIRCTLEARVKGHGPSAVTHDAQNVELAVTEAIDKLTRMLEHQLARIRPAH